MNRIVLISFELILGWVGKRFGWRMPDGVTEV